MEYTVLKEAIAKGDKAGVAKYEQLVNCYTAICNILKSGASPEEMQSQYLQCISDYQEVLSPEEMLRSYETYLTTLAQSGKGEAAEAATSMLTLVDRLKALLKDDKMSPEEKASELEKIKAKAAKLMDTPEMKGAIEENFGTTNVEPGNNSEPETLFLLCWGLIIIGVAVLGGVGWLIFHKGCGGGHGGGNNGGGNNGGGTTNNYYGNCKDGCGG